MTKQELYKLLYDLADSNSELQPGSQLYNFCLELFNRLGIPFLNNNPEKIVERLQLYEAYSEDNKKEVVSKIDSLSEEIDIDATNDAVIEPEIVLESESNLGPVSLNSQELRGLIEALNRHEEEIGKEKANKESIRSQVEALKKTNKRLARVNSNELEDAIERRREFENENLSKSIPGDEAEKLADKKLLAEEQVREVAPEITNQADIEKLAELVAKEELVVTEAAKMVADKQVVTELVELGQQVIAEKIVENKVNEIARKAVEEIKEEIKLSTDRDLSVTEEREIFRLIKSRVEEASTNPLIKVTDADSIKTPTKIVAGETVSEKIVKILETKPGVVNKTRIDRTINETGKAVNNLYQSDGVSASATLIRDKTEKMFARGVNPREIRAILEIRYPSENIVGETYQAVNVAVNNNVPDGKIETNIAKADTLRGLLKSSKSVASGVKKLTSVVGLDGVEGMGPAVEVSKVLQGNERLMRGMEMVNKLLKAQDRLNQITGGGMAQLGKMFGIEGLQAYGQKIMTQLGGEVGGAMATHLATYGIEGGIKSILGQLLTTGTVTAVKFIPGAVATGATAVAGEAAIGAAALATGPPGWVVGLIMFAAQMGLDAIKKAFGAVKNKVVDLLSNAGLVSKEGVEQAGDFLNKLGKGILSGLAAIGTSFLLLPGLLGSAFSLVIVVLVITIISILGYNTFQTASTQLSPLIINKAVTAGVCISQDDLSKTGPGTAGCNPDAPPSKAISVDKAQFVNVAERWRAGGGKNAEKCFNDVVCRAKTAGINPDYALWAWLHESGASNYDGFPSVSDFGVVFAPKNDFNAQITAFLKLDPASGCLGKNGISDYWLAFAANYLNGTSNCDPDFLNVSSNITPRQYLSELQSTWGWISSRPMPSSIRIPPEKCGDGTETATTTTGPDGTKYVCEQSGDASVGGSSAYDPNAPGLTGEVIPGECSVSDKVVLTKQCQGPWATKSLPRGGTICQAGCGPTSVSMMLRHGNGSWTPDSVIYSPGSAYSDMGSGGSSLDQAYLTLVKQFGGGAVTLNGATRSCDEKTIGKWICAGKVVMVLEDAYTKSGTTGHFVLGVAVQNGNIVTADPYYSAKTPFDGKKEYGHAAAIRGCLTVDAAAIK